MPESATYTLIARSINMDDDIVYSFVFEETTQTELPLDVIYNGSFRGSGQAEMFHINVQDTHAMRIKLDDTVSDNYNELYLKYGSPPTRGNFDYRYSNLSSSDQEIIVLSANPGDWYLLVYGDTINSPDNYTLIAEKKTIILSDIFPKIHGDVIDTVITLNGAGYENITAINLISPAASYPANSFEISGDGQAHATFLARSIPAGLYSVEVVHNEGGTDRLDDVFEMIEGGIPKFETNLILPSRLGYHHLATIYVEFSNTGYASMTAPVLILNATQNAREGALMTLDRSIIRRGFWTSVIPEGFDTSVQFLASGDTPGILQPGETKRIPIYYTGWLKPWNFSYPPFNFTLSVLDVNNENRINWEKFENEVMPPNMDQDKWKLTFIKIKQLVGDTWGQYYQLILDQAVKNGASGEETYDVSKIFDDILNDAYTLAMFDGRTVTGQVFLESIREPLRDVEVFAYNQNSSGIVSTVTDNEGWYALQSLTPGIHELKLADYPLATDVMVNIDGSQQLYTVDLPVIGCGIIKGIVTDSSGNPLEGAVVYISNKTRDYFNTAYTDKNGNYTLSKLTPDTYTVQVDSQLYVSEVLNYLQVTTDTILENIDFELVKGAVVVGSVTDSEGLPIEGASVFAITDAGTYVSATTNTNGSYMLAGLSASGCKITVIAPGYIKENIEIKNLQLSDTLEDINFSMQTGIPVHGQVVGVNPDNNIAGVVLLFFREEQLVAVTTTDSDGYFITDQCPPGQYTIQYSLTGYNTGYYAFDLPAGGLLEPLRLQLSSQPQRVTIMTETAEKDLPSTYWACDNPKYPSIKECLAQREILLVALVGSGAWAAAPTASAHLMYFISPPGDNYDRAPRLFNYGPDSTQSNKAKGCTGSKSFAESKKVAEGRIITKIGKQFCSSNELPNKIDSVDAPAIAFYKPDPCDFDLHAAFGGMYKGKCDVLKISSEKESEKEIVVKVSTKYVWNDVYNFQQEHCDQNPNFPWNCWAWELQRYGWATPFPTQIVITDDFTFNITKGDCDECLNDIDSDNDGTADCFDLCPNTPGGEVTDGNGCSQSQRNDDQDTDGDGIPDYRDYCSDTPIDETARWNGCSESQQHDCYPPFQGQCNEGEARTDCGCVPNGAECDPPFMGPCYIDEVRTICGCVPDGGICNPPFQGPCNKGEVYTSCGCKPEPCSNCDDGGTPDPDTPPGGGGSSGGAGSIDPNQKTGPIGVGAKRFITPGVLMPYKVEFENDPEASAPAQIVTVTDQLVDHLDWTTFELTEIGFGDHFIPVPVNTQYFEWTEPMNYNGMEFDVRIEAGIHLATGEVYANFYSIDPDTGLPPGVEYGFLPPEDGNGIGQGYFSFVLRSKDDLPDGTRIHNIANIIFDFQDPIATNQVDPHDPSIGTAPNLEAFNTIDKTAPTSNVFPLSTNSDSPFTVEWTGDDNNGSGIAMFDIFISENDGPWTSWITGTTDTSATYPGENEHTYRFFSIATDSVGNREMDKNSAEAETMAIYDNCPNDPDKLEPGNCGCGVAEGTCNGNDDDGGCFISTLRLE